MYQILSLSENKEYIITEDEWSAEGYTEHNIMDNCEIYGKPLFQTLLNFLNFDYPKKATDEFIEYICNLSKNCFLIDEREERIESIGVFCDFLYNLFPNEYRRKRARERKRRIKTGMTINRLFEQKGIERNKERLGYYEKRRKYFIELFGEYLNTAQCEEILSDPLVFRLFVNEFIKKYRDEYRYFQSDDIRICTATPLIQEFAGMQKRNIKTFAEITKSACFNNIYNEYIIKTTDDIFGHEENPFEYDNGLSELNVVISDIYFILQQGWHIKKCANCGKYFIVRGRSDIKYCSNPAPLDITKTCREYAATHGYYIERKNDELEGLRNKIKGRLNKRAQRDSLFREQYDIFNSYDRKWRTRVKETPDNNINYLAWLNDVDRITKGGGGRVETARPLPPRKEA